jgi:hypothetical protein
LKGEVWRKGVSVMIGKVVKAKVDTISGMVKVWISKEGTQDVVVVYVDVDEARELLEGQGYDIANFVPR